MLPEVKSHPPPCLEKEEGGRDFCSGEGEEKPLDLHLSKYSI
jgi:hypothetical protein